MKSRATAAWSVTGLAAAAVVAFTLCMALHGGASAAPPLGSSAPLVVATIAPNSDNSRLPTGTVGQSTRAGADISGPCDEAEHATDPRCSGAANGESPDDPIGAEDRRGRDGVLGDGRGDDSRGRDDSSGRGSGGDDSSGPGSRDRSGHSGHDDSVSSGRDDSGDGDSGHGD